MSLKKILFSILIAIAVNATIAFILFAMEEEFKPFRVGLLPDIQYADKPDSKTRFYRSSIQKLEKAVQQLNQDSMAFSIVLGDLVDEGPKDLAPINQQLKQLHSPYYTLLGNHDYPKTFEKDLHKKFGLEEAYNSVHKMGWLFILLNTNDLASYSVEKGSKKEKEYLKLKEGLEKDGRQNLQDWNGGIGKNQIEWLKGQLHQAERLGNPVIIFTHHPLLPENGLETLNNREILEIIKSHNMDNKIGIRAVISAHHHPGNYVVQDGVPFITLEGMVETQENAFGYLEIFKDKVLLRGYGRMTDRTITW